MRQLILLFSLVVACAEARTDRTIELHKVSEIADIEVLDQEVEQLVAKVRQCAAAGLAPASDCYCQYPGKLAATKHAYDRVANKYPNWTDGSVRWWGEGKAFSSNLYLRGIRQQLEQPCI